MEFTPFRNFAPNSRWPSQRTAVGAFSEVDLEEHEMLQIGDKTLTSRDLVRVLFRHWKKAFLFFVMVNVIALLGILLQPKRYLSEAKLFVRLGRESIGIDPTVSTGQIISLSQTRESEIATVQNLLNSRVVFEQVVDKITPDVILKDGATDDWVKHVEKLLTSWIPDSDSENPKAVRELALRKLSKTLELENPRKSHLFTLGYKSQSPDLSQKILETYLDICKRHYAQVNHSDASFTFFVDQTERLRAEVEAASRELSEAKSRLDVVSVEGQRKVFEDHVTNLQKELLTTKTALASAKAKVNVMRKLSADQVAIEEDASGLSNNALDDMRNQLYGLQLREREMLASFSPDHPKVLAIRRQVDEANKLLRDQEYRVEKSQSSELSEQVEALERQYQDALRQLKQINRDEISVMELQRRLDQLNDNYRLYMKNKEQALIDRELQSQRITNLADAQSPTVSGKPLSRMGMLIMSLALIVGTCGAVGLAFLCETMDDSIRSPEDVEDNLGVPVLMSIPRSRTQVPSWN